MIREKGQRVSRSYNILNRLKVISEGRCINEICYDHSIHYLFNCMW